MGEWEFITPDDARVYLECRSGIQRNINKPHVARLAKMMREGNWRKHAGGVICFDERGELLDGQHRLQAVIDSGVGQWFRVDTDCTREDFSAMDDGLRRRTSQFIDVKNASTVAAIVSYVTSVKAGIVNCRVDGILDRATLLEEFNGDASGYEDAGRNAERFRGLVNSGYKKYTGGVLYILAKKYGQREVDGFIDKLLDSPSPDALILLSRIKNHGDRVTTRRRWVGVTYYLFRCHKDGVDPNRRASLETQFNKFNQLAKEYFNVD